MKLISQMPRKDPRRVEQIRLVRNQTCDAKQKLIYCCGPNQESRTAHLCEYFLFSILKFLVHAYFMIRKM